MASGLRSESVISSRIILVSNRLPVTIDWTHDEPCIQPSSGGLVTALVPILREFGGCWVGWTGTDYKPRLSSLLKSWGAPQNYSLHPVFLSAEEKASFYNGGSNQIIWPLFHGLTSRCRFESAHWNAYRRTNQKFASAVQAIWKSGDFVWVQDYHLMLAGQYLRNGAFKNRTAYFHHIPFPAPDVFEALPWRTELLAGLMHYDLVGFQTSRDVRNFVASRISHLGKNLLAKAGDCSVTTGCYPVSIDFDEFAAAPSPQSDAIKSAIADSIPGTKVVLGVDRLDYTKGITQRLRAFRTLLTVHPEWRGRVTLFQIVIPSREEILEYKELKLEIERLVSEINGEYGTASWVPVRYFHRSFPREELLGFYRAADIALVTPLRDGMNLVAKEFCAARTDDRGVLVLSEFAGAAEELAGGALIVNPNDTDAIAASLYQALTMDEFEQETRMATMRFNIRMHDVFHWACSFTRDATELAEASPRGAVRVAGY
jgi:trehalose 6-phosphate synthase